MHEITISLSEEAYIKASDRAKREGFGSAEVYVTDLVMTTVESDLGDHAGIFTPEVIAELDNISHEIKAGAPTFTVEESREYLAQKRKQWLSVHPS